MQDYRINGIGVGHSPELFTRNENYEEFFNRIGNDSKNIHRIKNFITQDDASFLISITERFPAQDDPGQWNSMVWTTKESDEILEKYTIRVMQIFKDLFEVDLEFCGGAYIVRWHESKKMDLHVDDLGSGENHLSGVLYLNDTYEGGNINFPTHDMSIKPEKYELILFPGNLNYAHEVQEITKGSRFTVPFWAEIV